MADTVRIANLFSNFDTDAVIQQITLARQGPIRKLDQQRAAIVSQQSALNGLTTYFANLALRARLLAAPSSVSGRTATVDGTGVSAAAGPGSSPGVFDVAVTKIATGTALTGTAISSALDATVPLPSANFATPVSTGSFSVTTATGGSTTIQIGAASARASVPLASSNLATAVTGGSFTLATGGGGAFTLTVDPATQSLDDVVAAINVAGMATGLTASLTADANGRLNQVTLASTNGDITVGDTGDSSNLLAALNLNATAGTTTRTSSTAFTITQSLNEVLADINAAGIGVTATVTNDANGRPNLVHLTSTQGAISLGKGSDTSNFLSAANLLASPGTTSRTSTISVARISTSAKLASTAFFGGPPASGPHSFSINGVSIAYDADHDSLNDVIGRINASSSGVQARYDSVTDSIRLTQNRTGSIAMSLSDDGAGGDFLARTGLIAASQTLGANAEYAIDGGPALYSDTNIVSVSGTTLTLTAPTGDTPAKVTVAQDMTAAVSAVRSFVNEFNGLMNALNNVTRHNATAGKDGALSGDASVMSLQATIRSMVSGFGMNLSGNFKNLSQIGLSFGAVGSTVGSTNQLVFDESKFRAAVASDPSSVQSLVGEFKLAGTLAAGGSGSLASATGAYTGTKAGTYTITDDGTGALAVVFTPADGTAPSTSTGMIAAGGTNTAIIPGMTVTANATLTAGTNVIRVAPSSQSVIAGIRDYVDAQSNANGVISRRLQTYDKRIADIDARKIDIQARIDAEMDVMRKKFAAMEQAQSRAQVVQQSLTSLVSQLAANSGSK